MKFKRAGTLCGAQALSALAGLFHPVHGSVSR